MKRVINIGFPKEGEPCQWKDLWRAWHLSVSIHNDNGFFVHIIIPIGQITVHLSQSYSDVLTGVYSGWYRINIGIHFLNIIGLNISIPLGKWRHYETRQH